MWYNNKDVMTLCVSKSFRQVLSLSVKNFTEWSRKNDK